MFDSQRGRDGFQQLRLFGERGGLKVAENEPATRFGDASLDVVRMNPSRPSVVSGVSRAVGSRDRKSLRMRTALTIDPLPMDGCVLTPRTVTVAPSAENVSPSISPRPPPSSV
jgi:hypothetical protein